MMPLYSTLLSLFLFGAGIAGPKLVVPNFPSFKIVTRVTFGTRPASVNTLYMQGARTRAEYAHGASSRPEEQQLSIITLTQCDQKRNVGFDPHHKTFIEWPIVDWSERARHQVVRPPQPSGREVAVSIDSVDTGERRQVGSYIARHVKTTTRIEPGANSTAKPSLGESDGWYIDLPSLDCEDWGDREQLNGGWLTTEPNQRVRFSHTGSGKRGYPVEEISKMTAADHTYETRTELLEASSAALDPQLFELPAGYAHALQSPLGTDYSQTDTLSNRAAAYWTYFRQRWARAFQSSSGHWRPRCQPPALTGA
jgi:hypothetical protein